MLGIYMAYCNISVTSVSGVGLLLLRNNKETNVSSKTETPCQQHRDGLRWLNIIILSLLCNCLCMFLLITGIHSSKKNIQWNRLRSRHPFMNILQNFSAGNIHYLVFCL